MRLVKELKGCARASAGTRRDGKECIKLLELAFCFYHRMDIIPGIVRASGDADAKVSKMCQQYGQKISKQIAY